MTSTTVFETGKPENPLFTKLRRRFSYDGDRTVGEYMLAQVLKNDGSVASPCSTSELHMKYGNNLPHSSVVTRRCQKAKPHSRASLFLVAMCVIMLLGIVLVSINNYRLNQHVENLEHQISALNAAKAGTDVIGEYSLDCLQLRLPADEIPDDFGKMA